MMLLTLFFFSLYAGLWVIVSKREHILSVLLSFEFISIFIYFLMVTVMSNSDLFFSLVFIIFTACEGALGLSILVMMTRSHGGDYFKVFNLI